MNITYLDYNATAPIAAVARDAVLPFLDGGYANPSSPYSLARQVRSALHQSRQQVAASLGAMPSEILFTSGGTEAINLAIRGFVTASAPHGALPHVVTTSVEHAATLDTLRSLKDAHLADFTAVGVDKNSLWTPETILSAVLPTTVLVTVMLANNEVGTIYPVVQLGELLAARHIPLHVDAVQAYGKIPIPWADTTWAAMTVSAHKIGGLKGTGALCLRSGSLWKPTLTGGLQEHSRRGGTENVTGIVAFGAAATRIPFLLEDSTRQQHLRDRLEQRLLGIHNTIITASDAPRLGNTTSVRFVGVDAESVIIHLDLQGFCVSAGSACTTGSTQPSHVLRAMGFSPMDAFSTVRISLGSDTQTSDIDRLVDALSYLIPKLREEENAGL